jgi:hypothetical protein
MEYLNEGEATEFWGSSIHRTRKGHGELQGRPHKGKEARLDKPLMTNISRGRSGRLPRRSQLEIGERELPLLA